MKKVRIVYVSVFSGVDFFAMGWKLNGVLPGYSVENNKYAARINMANHVYPDGTVLIKTIEVQEGDIDRLNIEPYEMEKADGKQFRYQRIQDVTGQAIREEIEHYYGKDVIIVFLGGAPCQDFCKLNHVDKGRRALVFEYLRVLNELRPEIGLMEEIPDMLSPKHKHIWDEYTKQARLLPYQIACLEMNALNYGEKDRGGCQSRKRLFVQMVRTDLGKRPVFPEPTPENAKRFGQVIKNADHFFSGHFYDKIKGKEDWMITLTSSSPVWFDRKDGAKLIQWEPSIEELLPFQGVLPGEIIIPQDIPYRQVRKCIGNGVEVSLSSQLAKTIIEKVLCLKHEGDGWFVPIDAPDDGTNGTTNPTVGVPPLAPVPDKVPPALPPVVKSIMPAKIISSQQLANMGFDTLNFSGKWEKLFGMPSANHHCIVHGLSGSGKSTFCIQYAKYLADNLGKVLFISGEEGFSKTLQNKLLNTNAESPNLYIAELKNFNDIMREVKPGVFPFIFIDSLQHMKIDAVKMRQIRAAHKGTVFITISQSTKAGEMRGSYELIHDCDILIEVKEGLAITTKNRFKETGCTFNVFEVMNPMTQSDQVNESIIDLDNLVTEPPVSKREEDVVALEYDLNEAIENENFEKAAEIRDMINKIIGKKK